MMLLCIVYIFFLSVQAEHMPTALLEEIFLWQFYDSVLLGWSCSREYVNLQRGNLSKYSQVLRQNTSVRSFY